MKRPGFGRMPSVQPGANSPYSGLSLQKLIKARAEGGPRDGVLIEALPTWTGTVSKPTGHGKPPAKYRGRYKLDFHPETYQPRWVWQADAPLRSDGAKNLYKE